MNAVLVILLISTVLAVDVVDASPPAELAKLILQALNMGQANSATGDADTATGTSSITTGRQFQSLQKFQATRGSQVAKGKWWDRRSCTV